MYIRHIYVCSNHYINNSNFLYFCDLDLLVKTEPNYDNVEFHLWTSHNYITLVQVRFDLYKLYNTEQIYILQDVPGFYFWNNYADRLLMH